MKVKEEGIVFNFGFKVDSIKCLKNGNKNFSTMIHLYIKEKIYQTSQEITLAQGSDPSYRYSGFLLKIKIYNIEKNLEDIPNLYKKIKKEITNIQKDIKKLTEEEIKELDNISHYNGFKELFKSFIEAHQITANYEKLTAKLSSNNEIKSTIKKNKI